MSPSGSTVLFRALPPSVKLPQAERKAIREFAARLSREVCSGRHFTCLMTTDAELRTLNRQFLDRDYATDVLSFPLLDGSDSDLGEIAISLERAGAQATEFRHSRLSEVCLLMLHGLLHLAGLDHESDRGEMAAAEERWRSNFALPSSLIVRAGRLAELAREEAAQ